MKFKLITKITFVLIVLSVLVSIYGVFYAGMCSITRFPGGLLFCDIYIWSLIIIYWLSIMGIVFSAGYWIYGKIKNKTE